MMLAPNWTPRDLVEALHRRDDAARPQLWKWVREPIVRLMDDIIARQRLEPSRERIVTHALHSAETFLRTRPVDDFTSMTWSAFRAAVLLHVAKQASQPFGAQVGGHLGPTPLPESPLYQSTSVSLPYERVGNYWYGGDWFAGRHAPDGSLWVIVADITGHGYYAYLLASTLPSVWQACWKGQRLEDLQPADLLAAMHELLQDCLPDSVYVECTLVRLTPGGEATIAPAGGSRVLLRRGGARRADLLKLRGTWLGLRAPTTRDQQTWRLDAGDELLLGTDGMFDQFGGHDSLEVVEMLSDVPHTRTLLDEVQLRLRERLRRVPQKDDITMVLLRRRARAEEAALTAAGNGADNVPV